MTHPLLNYVPSRGALELLWRSFDSADRAEMRWIVVGAPVTGPCVCLSIHMIANLFGVFPVPYAVLTSCFPGVVATILVARHLAKTRSG